MSVEMQGERSNPIVVAEGDDEYVSGEASCGGICDDGERIGCSDDSRSRVPIKIPLNPWEERWRRLAVETKNVPPSPPLPLPSPPPVAVASANSRRRLVPCDYVEFERQNADPIPESVAILPTHAPAPASASASIPEPDETPQKIRTPEYHLALKLTTGDVAQSPSETMDILWALGLCTKHSEGPERKEVPTVLQPAQLAAIEFDMTAHARHGFRPTSELRTSRRIVFFTTKIYPPLSQHADASTPSTLVWERHFQHCV